MTSFTAKHLTLTAQVGQLADFFGDMQNFQRIMPEQVENWTADKSSCSFFIKNLGDLGMNKGGVNLPHSFEFPSNESSKVNFTLTFHLLTEADNTFKGYFEITTQMNAMIEMIAKRPLTNFVNLLNENLQKQF